MAFTNTSNLQSNPLITLRDQQHAARVFTDQQFKLAPKFDFLFHVSFKINVSALKNANIVQRYGEEINLMVKGIDLPNFTIQTETLNQYNRKKNLQYQHSLGEVTVKFHDDNMSLINQVWQNYYSYYYADSTSAQNLGAYTRNATKNSNHIPTSYGFDNKSTNPFFNQIKVYQMAKHEFVCYTLINPIITSFDHDKLNYSSNKTREFTMKFKYEAVTYSTGSVEAGNPEGFGMSHYDTTPSPLSGVSAPGKIQPGFVQALDTNALAPGILNNAISQINANQNAQQSNAGGGLNIGAIVGGIALGSAAIGIGSKILSSIGNISGLGLPDFSFPGSGGNGNSTTATPNPTTETVAAEQAAADEKSTTDTASNTDNGGEATKPDAGDQPTGDPQADPPSEDTSSTDSGDSGDTTSSGDSYDF
jgi:hypothetical protein